MILLFTCVAIVVTITFQEKPNILRTGRKSNSKWGRQGE